MTAPGGADDAERRLAALEETVSSLAAEMAALRTEIERRPAAEQARSPGGDAFARMAVPSPPPPVPPRSAPEPPRPATAARRRLWDAEIDVEALVGRYGTMLLGALTILLGVGAFLRWAVQRVTLGPELRVVLGALGTAAVAALGLWLRSRDGSGTRRFGNVLLALSLALLHVVAWGAGPALGVVPPGVALGIAALASVALAALAWRADEQALFVVGAGGALIAPFVTSSEAGNPLVLLGYGLLVTAAAVLAQRERDWPWARRVLSAGVLTYMAASIDMSSLAWPAPELAWLREGVPAVFVLACAAVVLAAGGRSARSTLARQWLLLLAIPLFSAVSFDVVDLRESYLVALALAGTVGVYLALRLRDARQTLAVASAIAQPPLLLLAVLPALPHDADLLAATAAAVWATVAFAAALDAGAGVVLMAPGLPAPEAEGTAPAAGAPLRLWTAHLLVAGMLGVAAVGLATSDERLVGGAALAAAGVGAAYLVRRTGAPLLLLTPLVALLVASSWVLDLLGARTAYEYVPFLGAASLAAAAVVAGWWAAGRLVAGAVTGQGVGPTERSLLTAAGPAAAFAWGYVELGRAFSPDLADFLVILYLATAGVLCIALGRRQQVPGGRRIGLALAIWAALRALAQASDFDSVGLRVGAYLLVGVFLLGVAYWYRAAGEAERPPVADPAGTGVH